MGSDLDATPLLPFRMSLLDAMLLNPYPFEVWIARRSDGARGSGSARDPFSGNTAAVLDPILAGLPAGSRVHFGPGVFETAGYADGESTGWQPKMGMSIEGSGIGVTTLRLVGAAQNKHYFAVGHALTGGSPAAPTPVDFFEISDLTIDCNLAGQPGSQPACGAVRIMGNHSRIRRVQAINWGTKSTGNPGYVLASIVSDFTAGPFEAFDAGIEECLVVQPATAQIPAGALVTLIHLGGRGIDTTFETYGKTGFIRNCYVDAGSPTAAPAFRGLSVERCRGGIVEGNQVHNIPVGGPVQEKSTNRDVIVRNNRYRNVLKGPCFSLPTYAPVIDSASLVFDSQLVTATLSVDHGLAIGDRVYLVGPGKWIEVTSASARKFTGKISSGSNGNSNVQKLYGADRLIIRATPSSSPLRPAARSSAFSSTICRRKRPAIPVSPPINTARRSSGTIASATSTALGSRVWSAGASNSPAPNPCWSATT